jgi:hypothetical protein
VLEPPSSNENEAFGAPFRRNHSSQRALGHGVDVCLSFTREFLSGDDGGMCIAHSCLALRAPYGNDLVSQINPKSHTDHDEKETHIEDVLYKTTLRLESLVAVHLSFSSHSSSHIRGNLRRLRFEVFASPIFSMTASSPPPQKTTHSDPSQALAHGSLLEQMHLHSLLSSPPQTTTHVQLSNYL